MAIAVFFAERIKNGETTFTRVPIPLKGRVKKLLEESGHGHLIVEEG